MRDILTTLSSSRFGTSKSSSYVLRSLRHVLWRVFIYFRPSSMAPRQYSICFSFKLFALAAFFQVVRPCWLWLYASAFFTAIWFSRCWRSVKPLHSPVSLLCCCVSTFAYAPAMLHHINNFLSGSFVRLFIFWLMRFIYVHHRIT